MELSKRTLKQIENIKAISDFDVDKRIAYVELHYQNADDLVDVHLSGQGIPVISEDTIDYFRDIIADIPKEFNVAISIIINDYGVYDHQQLLDSIKKTIENTYYYYDEDKKKNNVIAIFFILIGLLLLAFEVIGGLANWYGPKGTVSKGIVETILEVFVWVFIWEGGAILLLTYENEATVFNLDMERFYSVSFKDNNDKLLGIINREDFYKGWISLEKKEILARNYILFSNAFLLALLVVDIVQSFTLITESSLIVIISAIIKWGLILILSVSNISFYREKGILKNCALVLSFMSLFYNIIETVYMILSASININNLLLEFLFIIYLIINIVCLLYIKKQHVNINENI